jgi:hypothetical protein
MKIRDFHLRIFHNMLDMNPGFAR